MPEFCGRLFWMAFYGKQSMTTGCIFYLDNFQERVLEN